MSETQAFVAIVLAAGQGTRMRSAVPKVLHPIAGRPMVTFPIERALDAGAEECVVVVGHGREQVESAVTTRFPGRIRFAVQTEQRGTGDAVRVALAELESWDGLVVVLNGDIPLLPTESIEALIVAMRAGSEEMGLVTAHLEDPTGYGRILRDEHGRVCGIREHKDASTEVRDIREVNPGIYAFRAAALRAHIGSLDTNNAQGELYLTDLVARSHARGGVVDVAGEMRLLRGINDRHELAQMEGEMRAIRNRALAVAGVTLRDPATTFVDADAVIEPEAIIEPAVTIRGRTHIGAFARIDVGCVLTNVIVHPRAYLKPYSVATDSEVGELAEIGPFSHLRPGSDIGPEAHVGNFVETKKTKMGRRSKANHLAYLGDGQIGERVNVGAGTIFCNYDGFRKHVTVLEDGAFIGSDSQLVAPVRVGKGAYVASGTTVTRSVPEDALAVGRARQVNKEGYGKRLRDKLAAEKRPSDSANTDSTNDQESETQRDEG